MNAQSLTQLLRIVRPIQLRKSASGSVNLSFKIYGSGKEDDSHEPPIIICHGLLSSKRSWKNVGKTIEKIMKRSVVTVDLRNHGKSPHTSSHRYEEQAADILQLIKKLEVDRVSLVGHNMGGRTAMCVALMEPSVVAALLVVDMSPVSTCPKFKKLYTKLMKEMLKVEWNHKKVHNAQRDVKKQLKHVVMHDALMKSLQENVNVRSDGTIGADDLPGIIDTFPRAVVQFVPGAGHHVHADDTHAFLQLAIAFLRKYS